MKKKTARRWLARNGHKIAWGLWSAGSRFHNQMILCRKTTGSGQNKISRARQAETPIDLGVYIR